MTVQSLQILPQDVDPFLTVDEVATLLRLSTRTVRRCIESGRLVAVRTSGQRGRIRISRVALETFLADARVLARAGDVQ